MAKNAPTSLNEGGQKPKYQVLERCYLPVEGPAGVMERILDPETMPFKTEADGTPTLERVPLIVTYDGVPAHYLKPLNAAARAKCEQYPERMTFNDPINKLTVVGQAPATPTT